MCKKKLISKKLQSAPLKFTVTQNVSVMVIII